MSKPKSVVIAKAGGPHVLEAAPQTGALEILGGQFNVRANNSVTFPYYDPPLVEEATSGRDIDILAVQLKPGENFQVYTSTGAKTTFKWRSQVYQPAPAPVPEPDPGPQPEPEPEPPPVPLPPAGTKRVLSPADLTYLGAMRVPESGVDMMFSYGGLTGRKVNGKVHLLMFGSSGTAGDPVYELADTGAYHADLAQAPRMALVRDWGKVYGTARKSWNPDGTERLFSDTNNVAALHFNEQTQLLYWTFRDTYNTTYVDDWCLGATRLDPSGPVAFGPWRPSGEGKKGPWRCIRLAQHPVSGELLCGSSVMSGNANSPWGPDLWAGQFPTSTTPSGFGAPDLPIQKYLTYYRMIGNVNLDGSWSGPLQSARRPGDYVFEPIPDITLTEIDPQKNGGIGSWTQSDGLGGSVWIDLPDVHGVLFTGCLAAGHVWYRNAGGGNDRCTHGVASPVQVTGPVSTEIYPVLIMYDPAELEAVRRGDRVDYTIDAAHFVNAEAKYGVKTAPVGNAGAAKTLGGCYFDRDTRKLYICAPMADATIAPSFLNPLVHVFQITA